MGCAHSTTARDPAELKPVEATPEIAGVDKETPTVKGSVETVAVEGKVFDHDTCIEKKRVVSATEGIKVEQSLVNEAKNVEEVRSDELEVQIATVNDKEQKDQEVTPAVTAALVDEKPKVEKLIVEETDRVEKSVGSATEGEEVEKEEAVKEELVRIEVLELQEVIVDDKEQKDQEVTAAATVAVEDEEPKAEKLIVEETDRVGKSVVSATEGEEVEKEEAVKEELVRIEALGLREVIVDDEEQKDQGATGAIDVAVEDEDPKVEKVNVEATDKVEKSVVSATEGEEVEKPVLEDVGKEEKVSTKDLELQIDTVNDEEQKDQGATGLTTVVVNDEVRNVEKLDVGETDMVKELEKQELVTETKASEIKDEKLQVDAPTVEETDKVEDPKGDEHEVEKLKVEKVKIEDEEEVVVLEEHKDGESKAEEPAKEEDPKVDETVKYEAVTIDEPTSGETTA